ncbi:MAG: quinone-dependent dihydroorotate dehydrogenase [Vulcanimicrobiaceae bacterium]
MSTAYRLARPFLHALDAERAHALGLRALERGLGVPRATVRPDPSLRTTLFGRPLAHPLGLAAGFDKDARVVGPALALGFAFVEVGGVTPLPQPGNPRPRVFRLAEDRAAINRMGLPSEGAEVVAGRLDRLATRAGLLGVNLAPNTASTDPVADLVALAERFAPRADYLALDISCPNVVGGRRFSDPEALDVLLARVVPAMGGRAALALKLSPDLAGDALDAIVAVAQAHRIGGLIVGNTTLARAPLRSRFANETGGLSGAPLFARALAAVRTVAERAGGTPAVIGCGGIASGADAYAMIRAGAVALQLYTALVYAGPAVVVRIARELADALRAGGFATLASASGSDCAAARDYGGSIVTPP